MSRPSSRASHGNSRSRSSSRHSSYSSSRPGGSNAGTAAVDPDDFCNAFWGDKGYEALLSKVKASSRMLDDLRMWFRERSAIEDEYAKKMARLGKAPVMMGGYEVGGMKDALEVVRKSTAQSSHSHAELAGTIKTAMEVKLGEFIARRDGLRKNSQGNIERLFKKRMDLADASEKARKKYEADAIAVNGFTAQTHLVQGRDLDKVSNKLDKAQSSVALNEKEYRMYVKHMKEATGEWSLQWKGFCDLVQDMEEDRIDFLRATFWDYANSVSTICVVDDEQCEKIRTSLERCETKRDIKTYVKLAGTGGDIVDAPDYVNYARGEQTLPKPAATTANFARSSTRNPNAVMQNTTSLQDLAQAIRTEPPSPAAQPEPELPQTPPTQYQQKVNTKRGGSIADMVAANSMKPASPGAGPSSSHNLASPQAAPPRRAASPGEAMLNAISKPAVPPSVAAGAYVPPQYVPPPQRAVSPNPKAVPPNMPQPPMSPSTATGRSNRYSGLPAGAGNLAQPGADLHRTASKGSSAAGSATGPINAALGRANSTKRASTASVAAKSPLEAASSLPPPVPPPEDKPRSRAPSPAPSLQPPSVPGQGGAVDPLVAALEKLRSTPSMGSIRSPVVRNRSPGPPAQRQSMQLDDRRSGTKRNTLDIKDLSIGGEPPRAGTPVQPPAPERRESQADPYRRAASPAARPPSQVGEPARTSSLAASTAGPDPSTQGRAVSPAPAVSGSGAYQRPYSMAQPGQPFRQSTNQQRPQSHAQPSSTTPWQQPLRDNVQRAPSPAPPLVQSPLSEPAESDMMRSPSRNSRGARLGQMMGGQRSSVPPARQPSPAPPAQNSSPVAAAAPPQQQPLAPQQPYTSQYVHQRQPSGPPPPNQYQPPQPPPQPGVYPHSQSVQPLHQQPLPPPQQHPTYGYAQSPFTSQTSYQTPQQVQQSYMTPSQSFQHQPYYQQPPPAQQPYHPIPNGYGPGPGGYGPPPPNGAINGTPNSQRTSSMYSSTSLAQQGYYGQPSPLQQQQPAPVQQQPQQPPQQQAPPPQPQAQGQQGRPPATGSYTERGQPILFYVRALYDYGATQQDEFSFQAGDVIAITQTNPDGWWQGELLDEQRRGLEGNVLPSNFVTLLD